MGGTLGERAHKLYNEGDGKHMGILEIIFLCVLLRIPTYFGYLAKFVALLSATDFPGGNSLLFLGDLV